MNLLFNKKRKFLFMASIIFTLGSFLTFYGCTIINGDDDDDDKTNLALAALALSGSSGSSEATATIPESVTGGSKAISSSVRNTKDVITDAEAKTALKGIYSPVRSSVRIARDITDLANNIIDELETGGASKATPGAAYSYTDSSDTISSNKVFRITETTTFGGTGKKLEMWWKQNSSSAVTAVQNGDVKNIEFEYYKPDGEGLSTDGVMFFKFQDPNSTSELVTVRAEYKRDTSTGLRTTLVHAYQFTDPIRSTSKKSNSAFYITEDSSGLVNVDGVLQLTGIKMPFVDDNTTDTTNWGTDTVRAYMFKAIGSDKTNHAIVKVILPKSGDNASSASDPFADGQAWSIGELYTDGLLTQLNNQGYLSTLNTSCGGTSITTTSSQSDLSSALSTWESTCPTSDSGLDTVKAIINAKNPVYFLKTSSANELIGQEDTDDLSTVSGANTTTYTTYEQDSTFSNNAIRNDSSNGGDFTFTGIQNLNITNGTSVGPISGHDSSIVPWTNESEAAPTDVTAVSIKQPLNLKMK